MTEIVTLCTAQPLGEDFTTEWVPVGAAGQAAELASLEIVWTNAAGTLDGIINVEISNSGEYPAILSTITIDSATNADDANMIIITAAVGYIRLNYTAGNVTGGTLSAKLLWRN